MMDAEVSGPSPSRGWMRSAGEFVLAFFFGVLLMHLAYAGPMGGRGADGGVPGHDSFYHIRMAAMLPSHGLVREFPWLRFCYFTDSGQTFISHHFGFHVLLSPFVELARRTTGNELDGGRWAVMAFFGAAVGCFQLIMMQQRVPFRWVWLLLVTLLPFQFFSRHAFVRAISPSLALMLLQVWSMYRGRYLLTGLVIAAYIQLYLGGATFSPLLVGCHFVAVLVGPREQRRGLLGLAAFSIGGWVVGLLVYPYSGGALEFLRLQVFGTGLSPDIGVGQEWNPYENVWWFANMSGVILAVWMAAIGLRLRFGPRIDSAELSMFLMALAFLVLTLKARRFVEYWPMFSLLSAAMLSGPILRTWRMGFRDAETAAANGGTGLASAAASKGKTQSNRRGLNLIWTGLGLVTMLSLAVLTVLNLGGGQSWLARGLWLVMALAAVLWLMVWIEGSRGGATPGRRGWAGRAVESAFVLGGLATVMAGGQRAWAAVQRDTRCPYDLAAVRDLMDYLKAHSQAGEVVFTDDWDIFPVFFFHNTHNHYIVGLDPKFTHHRRPDLWERYVKISRGQVPADVTVRRHDDAGLEVEEVVHARLEDIRDHFGAKWVITDKDHEPLATKLSSARHLAELVYPGGSLGQTRDAPFRLFRIRDTEERPADLDAAVERGRKEGALYLSAMTPLQVDQSWGDLAVDRSVGGGPLYIGDAVYSRGLGTHAPAKIEYEVPEGFRVFEAVVGLNHSTRGKGSATVAVWVDGVERFRSEVLTGAGGPVAVRVNLEGAKKLALGSDPTGDGNAFDHVDWAEARLLVGP